MAAIKHLEKLKNTAYFHDGELPCIVREMRHAPSNTFIAMHDHEFSELVIVAAGSLSHIHENATETLHAGDFFAIHPGERHGYAELADGTVVFNLLYHGDKPPTDLLVRGGFVMSRIFPMNCAATQADLLGRIPKRDLPHVVELVKAIRREESAKLPLRHDVCTALFAAVVLMLTRSVERIGADASDETPVWRAIDLINRNLRKKVSIKELCKVSGMSASTLHRAFKRVTGKSPGDYIIDMRAAKAQSMLVRPGTTLKAVARKTGFSNKSHLLRTLRKRFPESGSCCNRPDGDN